MRRLPAPKESAHFLYHILWKNAKEFALTIGWVPSPQSDSINLDHSLSLAIHSNPQHNITCCGLCALWVSWVIWVWVDTWVRQELWLAQQPWVFMSLTVSSVMLIAAHFKICVPQVKTKNIFYSWLKKAQGVLGMHEKYSVWRKWFRKDYRGRMVTMVG